MRVVLVVIVGPDTGQTFVFDQPQVAIIGRSMKCGEFRLGSDGEVSRTHVLVEAAPPACHIRDLGSRNFTYINERKVNRGHIYEGDVVRLGPNTQMVLRIEDPDAIRVYETDDFFVKEAQ